MKKLIIFGLLVLLIYGNCGSAKEIPGPESNSLPVLYFNGKNTLGCEIDGKIWVNTGQLTHKGYFGGNVGIPNIEAIYSDQRRYNDSIRIQIRAYMYTKTRNERLNFNFAISELPKVNVLYPSGQISTTKIYYLQNYSEVQNGPWNLDSYKSDSKIPQGTSVIFSKVDTVSRIVSGEFSAKLFKNRTNSSFIDSVTVTNGRFNFKY